MGFKTKWNRFWTLRNTEGGFTLVELVVVIAILAILAGVSVPIYTNYMEKADAAADLLLVSAVNTAFATAVSELGYDTVDIADADVKISNQKVVGLVAVSHKEETLTAETAAKIKSGFANYFAGNENTTFKNENIKSLSWVDGLFVIDTVNVAMPSLQFGNGKDAVLNQDSLNDIDGSFIGGMDSSEVGGLMTDIQNGATDTLIGTVEDKVNSMGTVAKLAYKALQAAGVPTDELGAWVALQSTGLKNNTDIFGDQYSYIESTLRNPRASDAEREKAMNQFTNSMLLYTAEALYDEDPAKIQQNVIANYNSDADLISTGGNGAKVVSAAIRESLYQGYLKTEEGQKALANASGTDAEKKAALTGSDDFAAYLASPQGGNDIAGLIATMETIQSNKDQIGTNELVVDGMSNEDVQNLLAAIIS